MPAIWRSRTRLGQLQRTGDARSPGSAAGRVSGRQAQERSRGTPPPRHPAVDLDLEVSDEIGQVGVVGQDAASTGRRVDDDLRPRLE